MRVREARVPFEDFVRARSSRLLRTAFLLNGQNQAEAEDLLQIALERAYRHWHRISGVDEPELYVRRVLVNASADRWRRLARRPKLPLPAMPWKLAAVLTGGGCSGASAAVSGATVAVGSNAWPKGVRSHPVSRPTATVGRAGGPSRLTGSQAFAWPTAISGQTAEAAGA